MWHPLLSPSCMVTAFLGLQLASRSRASASGPGSLALAMCLGLLPAEGEMAGGHSHTAPMALSSQHRRATAPPAQRGGHRITTNSSGFGDLPPGAGEVEGGPVVAFTVEENMRLRKRTCQAKQGNTILLDEHCFWKDTVWSFSHYDFRHLTHHLDLLYYGLILPLCKAMSVLVAVITGIQLLVRCWKSYQSQRDSIGGCPKSPRSVVWGAADYPECAICLQACEPSWALKLLSCSHAYHGKCIDRWHRVQPGSKTCPLCLGGVTTVVLIHHPRVHNKQKAWESSPEHLEKSRPCHTAPTSSLLRSPTNSSSSQCLLGSVTQHRIKKVCGNIRLGNTDWKDKWNIEDTSLALPSLGS